jgi:hypothetical protein
MLSPYRTHAGHLWQRLVIERLGERKPCKVFSITLGHLSLLVEPYSTPAPQLVSSTRKGEVIIDLPMFRIYH